MGFRDLQNFNKALLAKQLWRMIRNPESLVSRVFKARYFKDMDIMEAPVKAGASYIWCSLVWSRDLVDRGKYWKVGDGERIRVFQDSWVKNGNESRLIGKETRVLGGDLRVKTLIDDEGKWNKNLLDQVLWPPEVDRVLITPIAEHGERDEIAWRFEPKGQFSVKSAYLLAIGFYEQHPSTSAREMKWWSKLVWHLSIPPKARVFMWRALSNLIPTEFNLKRQHVPVIGSCVSCGCGWDSTEHSLLFCSAVRQAWKKSIFWSTLQKTCGLELIQVAWAMRDRYSKEEYEIWVLMVWQIWVAKCKFKHGDGEFLQVPSEKDCRAIWEGFQSAKPAFALSNVMGLSLGEKKWKRPKRGEYRVDVDVLFDEGTRVFGVGVIVRNELGTICAALSKRTQPTTNSMIAEVMAVVAGIVFCMECDFSPIRIYTDSMLAARVMADPAEEADFLPIDIREILVAARDSILIGVFHMYRSANEAAHCLAQYARQIDSSCQWTQDFPRWLRDIVRLDVE